MPIIKLLPDEVPTPISTVPELQKETYQSQFANLIPTANITSLLRYVEGFPWEVKYYGQILNKDNGVNNYDPSIPQVLQPYYKINKLTIKVTSALESSYAAETGVTTVSGSGTFPFSVTPNVGDAFIANVENGEDCVFTINSVTRKTFSKNTLYEVSYSLTFFLSSQPGWLTNIESKVQQEYFYEEPTASGGKGNLVTPTLFEANNRLAALFSNTVRFYFDTFYNPRLATIVMPGQADVMYDPLLIKFLLRMLSTDAHINMLRMATFNYGNDVYLNQPSVWDSLLHRDLSTLYISNKKYRYISSDVIPNVSRFGGLAISGIRGVLYPVDANLSVETNNVDLIQPGASIATIAVLPVTNHNVTEPVLTVDVVDHQTHLQTQKRLLHSLFVNDYYVLSQNFYNHVAIHSDATGASLSFIESMVYKYMNKTPIAPEDLVIALQDYIRWPAIHQVYLLPVMWLILRSQGLNP